MTEIEEMMLIFFEQEDGHLDDVLLELFRNENHDPPEDSQSVS